MSMVQAEHTAQSYGLPAARPAVTSRPRLRRFPQMIRGQRPILWSGLGFILGAVFWHLVGFWTFLGTIVFNGDATAPLPLIARGREAPPVTQLGAKLASVQRAATACIKLVRDPDGSVTRAAPCATTDHDLPHMGVSTRQDQEAAAVAGRWDLAR